MLPNGCVRADTDGLVYRVEDVEWVCQPDDEDPGVLGPKLGAKPVSE